MSKYIAYLRVDVRKQLCNEGKTIVNGAARLGHNKVLYTSAKVSQLLVSLHSYFNFISCENFNK